MYQHNLQLPENTFKGCSNKNTLKDPHPPLVLLPQVFFQISDLFHLPKTTEVNSEIFG